MVLGSRVELEATDGETVYTLPDDFLIVHDETGDFLRRCDIYFVKPLSGTGRRRSGSGEGLFRAFSYFGSQKRPVPGVIEIPEGPWSRLARVREIRYTRPRQGAFYHPYEKPVWLYECKHPRAWRLALPEGCTVDGRGFVWP